MRRIFRLLIISLFFNFSVVSASSLITGTNALKNKIDITIIELEESLANFNDYLDNNFVKVANALDVETLNAISEHLQSSDYDGAFNLLKAKINDENFASLELAAKINKYLALKAELIKFVNDNKDDLNIDTGTDEGFECSFDLYDQIRTSFNLAKPTIVNTMNAIKKVLIKTVQNHLNDKEYTRSSKIAEEYQELSEAVSALIIKYNNSFNDYEGILNVISGNDSSVKNLFKKKFHDSFTPILNDIETSLKTSIDSFVNRKWEMLENDVSEIISSDKTISEKMVIFIIKLIKFIMSI